MKGRIYCIYLTATFFVITLAGIALDGENDLVVLVSTFGADTVVAVVSMNN